jgi:hypothetical protein
MNVQRLTKTTHSTRKCTDINNANNYDYIELRCIIHVNNGGREYYFVEYYSAPQMLVSFH